MFTIFPKPLSVSNTVFNGHSALAKWNRTAIVILVYFGELTHSTGSLYGHLRLANIALFLLTFVHELHFRLRCFQVAEV